MRFRLLGPLRVRNGSGRVHVAAGQPQLVLALLLAEAGRTISTERMIATVWEDRPPRSVANTVAAYALRLRRVARRFPDGQLYVNLRVYASAPPRGRSTCWPGSCARSASPTTGAPSDVDEAGAAVHLRRWEQALTFVGAPCRAVAPEQRLREDVAAAEQLGRAGEAQRPATG